MASSTSSSSNGELDADEKALKSLLDAFGSNFSLKDIASAYVEAGHNTELAGEILSSMQENNITGETYTDREENSEISSESSNSSGNFDSSSENGDANYRVSEMKRNPSSMSSVSGFTRKKYATASGFAIGVRPPKPEMRWVVKVSVKNPPPDPDVSEHEEFESFLFKMLQHGFRVDRDVIRQVLGECNYDLKKSLAKLLDIAAANHYSKYELNEGEVRERYQAVGAESLKDEDEGSEITRVIIPEKDYEYEEKDDEYCALRQAMKEHRSTMSEYYKAAAEAFAKGDLARSIPLMEKGQFFYRKAREANEESAKRMFSSSADEEALPLNLENYTAKEAISLVKSHLRNFSGIASIKYLRITNGVNEEDASRASRIRLIIKLLEKGSINWTEDEDSGTILVSLHEIDPERLSFTRSNTYANLKSMPTSEIEGHYS